MKQLRYNEFILNRKKDDRNEKMIKFAGIALILQLFSLPVATQK